MGMLKPGNTVIFRNARIDMFKDTMRLAVDKWGLIEVVEEPADFKVNEDNNMSEIEYELVSVPPKKQELADGVHFEQQTVCEIRLGPYCVFDRYFREKDGKGEGGRG
ncbi:hypothetical protein TRIUR3_03011 [Triticum urartu]|uniref:Single-stranded DNA binding protein Ssb-like OB fold domain-containing protein n=1 Tax=Triticum urartu TaxID=4572 RepID=M7YWX5_TRIUA|nr:hypothetical protein TRIUR3_03011 [Triticum urartu]